MADYDGPDKVLCPNFQIAISQEPLWVSSWNFQSFQISMIPTNDPKMKKFWEVSVSCPGWFDMELPLCTYLFMHLCQRKKIFIKIPRLILYLKLLTSIFCRFCILKWKVLGGWVWNLASFWQKLWEDLICEWPLTQAY